MTSQVSHHSGEYCQVTESGGDKTRPTGQLTRPSCADLRCSGAGGRRGHDGGTCAVALPVRAGERGGDGMTEVNPIPEGFPTVTPHLCVEGG